FQDAFSPFAGSGEFRWGSLAVMAIWTALGLVVAARTFGWEPRGSGSRRRGRRMSPARGT
ncbi:MAG: hypothetical protein MUP76_01335, partial [Acidimicrobiia bacterium]|nr:hypothetical protein [Acidimicrobiia bacterium]